MTTPATITVVLPTSHLLTFTVPGEPVSKARARFTNYRSPGRVYTPEKTRQAEERMAAAFRAAGGRHEPDKDATFGVRADGRDRNGYVRRAGAR